LATAEVVCAVSDVSVLEFTNISRSFLVIVLLIQTVEEVTITDILKQQADSDQKDHLGFKVLTAVIMKVANF
jgi:hypothetical protein